MTRLIGNLGVALATFFSLLLLILLVEITYLLIIRRSRRRQHQRNTPKEANHQLNPPPSNPTMSLLRCLCWKTQSRVKPAAVQGTAGGGGESAMEEEEVVDVTELMKVHNSRLLFTIKEGEREGIDSSMERSKSISVGSKEMNRKGSWDSVVAAAAAAADSGEFPATQPPVSLLVLLALERANEHRQL